MCCPDCFNSAAIVRADSPCAGWEISRSAPALLWGDHSPVATLASGISCSADRAKKISSKVIRAEISLMRGGLYASVVSSRSVSGRAPCSTAITHYDGKCFRDLNDELENDDRELAGRSQRGPSNGGDIFAKLCATPVADS